MEKEREEGDWIKVVSEAGHESWVPIVKTGS